MPAPDWRSVRGLMILAETAAKNGVAFSQRKFDRLWEICESAGVPALFMLAILPQEGTGSFDTSSDNKASDGGNGIESDWERDIRGAVGLVKGKLALYSQALDQGFVGLAAEIHLDGDPDQWVNWATAVVRGDGSVDAAACYAQHASWWTGVRAHFIEFGGHLSDLVEAARKLDKSAPRVNLTMRAVTTKTSLASNWNGTEPEPAVVVMEATVTGPAISEPVAEVAAAKEEPPVTVILNGTVQDGPYKLADSRTVGPIGPLVALLVGCGYTKEWDQESKTLKLTAPAKKRTKGTGRNLKT